MNETKSALVLEDGAIVEMLFSRDERAIAETERKYGRLFFSIAAGITRDAADAAECVNDTYMKLWDSIPPERPENLRAYGARIARNLSLNRLERNHAERRGGGEIFAELTESIPDPSDTVGAAEGLEEIIDRFLRREDRISRVMFVLRYWHCLPLEQVAKRTGTTVQTVKSRLFRTRKKLKSYLEKEGVSL